MMGSPDQAAQPPALQTPEPVNQQLVITIAQVCHILHQMTIFYDTLYYRDGVQGQGKE